MNRELGLHRHVALKEDHESFHVIANCHTPSGVHLQRDATQHVKHSFVGYIDTYDRVPRAGIPHNDHPITHGVCDFLDQRHRGPGPFDGHSPTLRGGESHLVLPQAQLKRIWGFQVRHAFPRLPDCRSRVS